MVALTMGVLAGIDPILCVTRGLISGALGWVAGALWAYLLAQLYHLGGEQMPPKTERVRENSAENSEQEAGRGLPDHEQQAA